MLTGPCRPRVGCRARIDFETDPVSSDSDWRDALRRRTADLRASMSRRPAPPRRRRRDRRFRRLLVAVVLFNVLAFGALAWALLRDNGSTAPARTVADHPPVDHDGSEHDEHSDNDERPSAAEAETEAEAQARCGARPGLSRRRSERERRAAGGGRRAGRRASCRLRARQRRRSDGR